MSKIPEFFIEMLNNQYPKEVVNNIIDGFEKKRKVTLRVNNLKTNINAVKKEFDRLEIKYSNVDFYENALILENVNEKELQTLNMYKNGEIYLQSLSSMLPPIILNPKPNMDILDMCAAPGGKTTELASLSNNESHITACEMNHIRLERLKYNIEKQGASCVYTMQKDARTIDDFFSFDSILLDAPCSGSGTINIEDKNIYKYFTEYLIKKSIKAQETLLRKALKILKDDGEMVYSTCSILSCENEEIISKVLKEFNAKIIPIELKGIEKLSLIETKIKGTLCICPNDLYEGFFVAKIKKF